MEPRRFAVDPPSEDDGDGPYQFVLEGHRTKDRKAWEETFTVLPALPPRSLSILSLGAVLVGDTIQWDNIAVVRFLRQVIVPDDEERWDVLMLDKDRLVNPAKLGEIMLDITGEKSRLPTSPRPSSPDGSRNGKRGSAAASSGRGSREK